MSYPQKHFSDLMPTQNSPIGPERSQNDPQNGKKSKSQKTKKSYKMKVININEYTPKHFLGLIPAPKIAR